MELVKLCCAKWFFTRKVPLVKEITSIVITEVDTVRDVDGKYLLDPRSAKMLSLKNLKICS